MAGRKKGGFNFKTRVRMEKAIRLEACGLADTEIASHIGISVGGLAFMKRRPEYQILVRQIATGVISSLDEAIVDDQAYIKQRVQEMVPTALKALHDAVLNPMEPRLRLEAAKQILDRDGRLAQVSRIGLPTQEQGGFAASQSDIDAADAIASIFGVHKKEENNTPTNTTEAVSSLIQ